MTRKDYNKAAEIVRVAASFKSKKDVALMTECFIALFSGDNFRFDEARFQEACKPSVKK
jgi:hypothetical protein